MSPFPPKDACVGGDGASPKEEALLEGMAVPGEPWGAAFGGSLAV